MNTTGSAASLPLGGIESPDSPLGLRWHQPKGEGCLLIARWGWKPRHMISTDTAGVGTSLPPARDESPGYVFDLLWHQPSQGSWGILGALLQPGGKSRFPTQPLLASVRVGHRFVSAGVGQSREVIVLSLPFLVLSAGESRLLLEVFFCLCPLVFQTC